MMESNWELDADDDQGCFINSTRSSVCYQGSVPVYAVNVTRTAHVQLAVKFASKHNLRLVTRNTGHDYLGRSTEKSGNESESAVTVGAGVQWDQLYRAASQHNRVIVGATCVTVGAAGGYPQGAGHSPLAPQFGLAADNILFWALRGGGGGTFGVVVEATHRTHPALDGLVAANHSITATNKSSFEVFLARFIELHPSLSDAGWSGYSAVLSQSVTLFFILPNGNVSFASHSLAPLLSFAQENGLDVTGGLQQLSSFEKYRLQAFSSSLKVVQKSRRL